jgi:hypothetical protein
VLDLGRARGGRAAGDLGSSSREAWKFEFFLAFTKTEPSNH